MPKLEEEIEKIGNIFSNHGLKDKPSRMNNNNEEELLQKKLE